MDLLKSAQLLSKCGLRSGESCGRGNVHGLALIPTYVYPKHPDRITPLLLLLLLLLLSPPGVTTCDISLKLVLSNAGRVSIPFMISSWALYLSQPHNLQRSSCIRSE
jgi:hypothetical protein